MDQIYMMVVDGHEIERFILSPEEYGSQAARDIVRRELAAKHLIPMHYIKLKPVIKPRYKWCAERKKKLKIDVDSP